MSDSHGHSHAVDTGKVTDRRKLRFSSFEDMWADVERIAAAERAGKLRRTGNWTAGQTFNHLATWIEYANDGFPTTLRPPWFVKLLAPLMKGRLINGPMPQGVRIPRVPGGTLGTEELPLDEAMLKLRRAWEKLLKAPPAHASPLFGQMPHQDWIKTSLRHAELHLGFLHP